MNIKERRRKILFVITKSNFGGAQRYVFDLATAAKQEGYDVAVALGGTGKPAAPIGALDSLLTKHGIRTIHVKHFMRDLSLFRDIRAVFELISIIKREQPDILHTSSSKAGGLGAFAGRVCSIKRIVFTSHGLTFNESWRPAIQRFAIKYVTWLTMMLAHVSIMISKETYELARKMPLMAHKVTLIYNGIGDIQLREKDDARSALDLSTLPDQALVLGTIAELHPNKNIASVLDALAQISSEKRKHIHFVIMGAGELETSLKERTHDHAIEDQVHFLGNVPDAATYLSLFDIFILPSFKEGLPYVLLEAGRAGLPTIASNISGNTDIIVHDENGLLIDPHDPTEIRDAIAVLSKDEQKRQSLGNALRETVSTTFSREKMVRETLNTYEQ